MKLFFPRFGISYIITVFRKPLKKSHFCSKDNFSREIGWLFGEIKTKHCDLTGKSDFWNLTGFSRENALAS